MPNYWFTSDLHLDHEKIIVYANRPFKNAAGEPDVDLMNKTLIDNWNAVVKTDDVIYILGDISCSSTPEKVEKHLCDLSGRKILIFGNHDKRIRKDGRVMRHFEWTSDFAEVKIAPDPAAPQRTQHIVLCHYAMRVWNKSHHGSWQLYGHSHGNLPDDPHARSMDVGVDNWDFKPVSFEQVREHMNKKIWKPVDHHTGERY